jgi:hypothetical protein
MQWPDLLTSGAATWPYPDMTWRQCKMDQSVQSGSAARNEKGPVRRPALLNSQCVWLLVAGTWSVHDFHTTVLRLANAVCGFNARTRFTEGFARDNAATDAARFKIRTNSRVATLGQTDVVAGRTRFVSVTSQHDLSRTTITICSNRIVENRSRFRSDI